VHNETQNRFVSRTNLMFLPGNKLADLYLLLWCVDPLLDNSRARKQPARQWTGCKAVFSTRSVLMGYKQDKV
jgi:hypothetical protein